MSGIRGLKSMASGAVGIHPAALAGRRGEGRGRMAALPFPEGLSLDKELIWLGGKPEHGGASALSTAPTITQKAMGCLSPRGSIAAGPLGPRNCSQTCV